MDTPEPGTRSETPTLVVLYLNPVIVHRRVTIPVDDLGTRTTMTGRLRVIPEACLASTRQVDTSPSLGYTPNMRLLIALAILLPGCGGSTPTPATPPNIVIGDSIAYGLAPHLPGYLNKGIGSQTTTQVLARWQQDVTALHPARVLVIAGINDVMLRLPEETTQANLSAMNAPSVTFATIGPHTLADASQLAEIDRLNTWIRANLRYVDMYAWGIAHPNLYADYCHPSPAGYDSLAQVILNWLK